MNRRALIFPMALAFLMLTSAFAHKFYLSLTQIEYNPQSETLEVAIKLFTDDLERCVGKRFRENLKLGEAAEHPKSNELIENYLSEKLKFTCEGETLVIKLLGKEVSVEETWCYVEVPLSKTKAQRVSIENRIFTEVFSTQINLVKFTSPLSKPQDLSLDKSNITGTLLLR